METIPFLVSVPEDDDRKDTKGIFSSETVINVCQVPVDALQQNLSKVSEAVLTVLKDIKKVGQFRLTEVTLQVEVTAEGGVCLIGTANLGGKGAISLKFSE